MQHIAATMAAIAVSNRLFRTKFRRIFRRCSTREKDNHGALARLYSEAHV